MGDGLAASYPRKKRFTFSFLSIEEDFGRGRILIWRVEHHSTQDIAGRRTGGFFLAEKRFTFAFLSIEEDFGKGRILIWRVEHHSTQDIAGRRTGGFFLAEKRFTFAFLSIREDFGRRRNRIGRTMDRIRQCGAYGNTARCDGQRSALHQPLHGAAFLKTDWRLLVRCAFRFRPYSGARALPGGQTDTFISLPNGSWNLAPAHFSPHTCQRLCTIPPFLPYASSSGKAMDKRPELPCLQNAAHRIRRCCILCNAQKYSTAANAVRSKGARGLILL